MLLESIRARPRPTCIVCGSRGEPVYSDLDDVLFGAPGRWTMSRCSNGRCGLLWLDPEPEPEDIGLAYTRYYTHGAPANGASFARMVVRGVRGAVLRARLGYEKAARGEGWRLMTRLGVFYPGGSEALAASAMFIRALPEGGSLLDVGCGAGAFMASMRDLGWSVVGVETDELAVERAVQRGLDVRHGGLEDAGFASASFDAVTMAHVIEHVHDPLRLLAETRRILKPGGTVVILTPNSRSWGHRHFGRDWRGLEPPRHIHIHNRDNLASLLEKSGLQPVRVATLAINASAVWSASGAIGRSRAAGNASAETPSSVASGIGPQLVERLRLKFDPDAGEDLLAIATRTA